MVEMITKCTRRRCLDPGTNVKSVTVKGKGRGRQKIFAIVQHQYNKRDSESARSKRKYAAIGKEWMDIWRDGSFSDRFDVQHMKKSPILVTEFFKKTLKV